MARTLLVRQELPAHGLSLNTPTFTAFIGDNDAYFLNDGKVILAIRNSNESATATVTISSVACRHNRTGDVTVTVPQATATEDGIAFAGPFPIAEFNQTGASDLGQVFVGATVDTVSIAPLHFV